MTVENESNDESQRGRFDEIAPLIMTPEEHNATGIHFPYCYEIACRNTALFYFGTRHFSDPTDRMFALIVGAVEAFKPDYLLVELEPHLYTRVPRKQRADFRDTFRGVSRERAVTKGDPYLGIKLAADLQIDVECPEPPLDELFAHLHKEGFSPQHVASFYLLRAASNYSLYKNEMSFSELITYRINMLSPLWPHSQELLSWELAYKTGVELFGSDVVDNPDALKPKISPVVTLTSPHRSVISDIAASVGTLVELTVVSRIIELTKEGKRPFVLFGASHALRHEKALRTLLRT